MYKPIVKIENPEAYFYEGDEGRMMMELYYTTIHEGQTIDYHIPEIDFTSLKFDYDKDIPYIEDDLIYRESLSVGPFIRLNLVPKEGSPYVKATKRVVDMTMKEIQEKLGHAFRIVPEGTL